MQFKYTSQTKTGEIHDGLIEAEDKFAAARAIREMGEIPLLAVPATKNKFSNILKGFSFGTGIKLRDKIIFARNLSGMLQAGLPISRALSVLTKQTTNEKFKVILQELIDTVTKGGTLSAGMQKFPKVFSTLFVSMVKAGEESGSMPQVLTEVGENLQKTYNLNKKIKGALTYPTIILCAMLLIGTLMLIFVVPTLSVTFESIGAKLPGSTLFIIWLSDVIKNQTLLIFGVLVVVVGGCIFLSKLPRTQKYFDYIILRLPVIGNLSKELNTARTARTLSSLLTSGVAMARALAITREVLQNVYYKKIIDESIGAIEKGEQLSEIFKKYIKLYPVMVGEMMEVGEETGNLASMLMEIATFYEAEIDNKTKDLSTIIEPVLMVIIGAGVGFFAISMITPMYSILSSIN